MESFNLLRPFDFNGHWVWVLNRGKVISWTKDKQPLWMFGTQQEISKRKQMELEITQERNLSNVLIDSAPSMFYLFDKNGQFLRWNKNFEKFTGYTEQEIANLHLLDLFQGNDKDLIDQQIERSFAIGHADVEAKLITKFGDAIPHFFSGNRIEYNGRLCILGLGIDISKRKKAEESIRKHNEELKKANEELDNFVYRVSHDIRAPISSTKGLINVARIETDTNKIIEYLNLINKSMNKLDSFILDILDYSRNSRFKIESKPINFYELLENVKANVGYMQQENDIKIDLEVKGKQAFYSDRRRLTFIFNNMLSNAIRFADRSKSESYLHIFIKITREQANIEFSDNGVGIIPEEKDKIFNMFYRANDFQKGSGLGL